MQFGSGMSPMTATARISDEVFFETPATDAGEFLPEDLELVRRIAGALVRRLPGHVELGELVALGNLGLVEAHRRYDARRGVPFHAFAATRIRGAMIDGLRREDPLTRDERARLRGDLGGAPSLQLVELDESAEEITPEERIDDAFGRKEELAVLQRALGALPERERRVVTRHFFDEQPLRSVGEELGVTESRACQIVSAALSRLRESLGALRA